MSYSVRYGSHKPYVMGAPNFGVGVSMYAAKLALVKRAVNSYVPGIINMVPRVEPKRPVSKLTRRLFGLLREAVKLHPERFYADKNFPRLLDALEKLLVFIAEEDGHYAGWLAEAMLLLHDIVEEERLRFPEGEAGDIAFYRWAAEHGIGKVK